MYACFNALFRHCLPAPEVQDDAAPADSGQLQVTVEFSSGSKTVPVDYDKHTNVTNMLKILEDQHHIPTDSLKVFLLNKFAEFEFDNAVELGPSFKLKDVHSEQEISVR